MKETKLLCDFCNKQLNSNLWNLFPETKDLRDIDYYTSLLLEYDKADDSELCKALIGLLEILQTDTCAADLSQTLSQNLRRIIIEQKYSSCTRVNAFKLYLKKAELSSSSHVSNCCHEIAGIFKDNWKYIQENVIALLQQNENLLSCFEIEQLIDLNIQALKCDLDKDSYNILLNSFSVFPMFVQRQVLEKMQQLDLEREVLQKNFVFPLLEKISVIIQELIQKEGEQGLLFSSSACYKHEKDSDELFLFSLSSDGGAVSNIAMLNACLDFIVALLSKAQNPQQLVEEKLVFIVNEFTKYLKESYSGPNELLMNTFAEWMSHLIDMIFERMDLENLALTSYSVNIQEMIIRVAISPLPLTATELNIRAFRHWLHLLSEPNKISRSLFSFRIVDNMTEELVDILAAAFDIACNDIDHRVRVAAFQVVVQALLLNDFPAYEIGMDMNQTKEYIAYRNDLINNILSTTLGWPSSADDEACTFACFTVGIVLICKKDIRETLTKYSCQCTNRAFFDQLLEFMKNVLEKGIPENVLQHLLYLVAVCLTFSDSCRHSLTTRVDFLNEILPLAISEVSSLTRGLSYVVISFFLGSGCRDTNLSEYETKLRSCKVQIRQDLMQCLDREDLPNSPMHKFYGLLQGSFLSTYFGVIKEHWSHLFRNALITLETVPLQFSKFSEIMSTSECSFGNISCENAVENVEDLSGSLKSSLLSSSPLREYDSFFMESYSDVIESSSKGACLPFENGMTESEKREIQASEENLCSSPKDVSVTSSVGQEFVTCDANWTKNVQGKRDACPFCLQSESEYIDWLCKVDELCIRLESAASCMEELPILTKQTSKILDITSRRQAAKTKKWESVFFEICSLQDRDNWEECCFDRVSLQESQESLQHNNAYYDCTQQSTRPIFEDSREVVKNMKDNIGRWLDEMDDWHTSSLGKLDSYFQQISLLESRVGEAMERLAMSRFHEDEGVSNCEKNKAKSDDGILTNLDASHRSDFLTKESKLHDPTQMIHSIAGSLKTSLYGEFSRWCCYLQDEVYSRLSENSDILGHLQMQIYEMKNSCLESNQLKVLLASLFQKMNKFGDFDRITRFDEDFLLNRNELDFLMEKLSDQRPLFALISLCIFLRDCLYITQEDLRESNDYLMSLQKEGKCSRNRNDTSQVETRMRDLLLQKERVYAMLNDLSTRWKEYFGDDFPDDDFVLQMPKRDASLQRGETRFATTSVSRIPENHHSFHLEEQVVDNNKKSRTQRRHEKLLLRALKVNNMRIEKIAKISMQKDVSRGSNTTNELISSSDYRKLQKEHKILLAVLAELYSEYCYLANQLHKKSAQHVPRIVK